MAHRGLTKAYRNEDFLISADARLIRLLSEYLEPDSRLKRARVKDTIIFFGSARSSSPEEFKVRWGELLERVARKQLTPEDETLLPQLQLQQKLAGYYDAARELAHRLTAWSKELPGDSNRFVLCSGGGPGMVEAMNRGAREADGLSIGLNISLPFEQDPNPYITRNLAFEFHYFFMRKFWFVYLARAVIVFPGGFGTFDEMMEVLTLVQTRKLKKKLPIVLFGSAYWKEVLNFDALVRWGMISREDLNLFRLYDDVEETYQYLTDELTQLYL